MQCEPKAGPGSDSLEQQSNNSVSDFGLGRQKSLTEQFAVLCDDRVLINPSALSVPKQKLGEGAFAQVSLCTYGQGKLVAVKRLKTGVSAVPFGDLYDFVREVQLLRQLRHRNVVEYIGLVADPKGEPLLVQEYCGGGSLKNTILQQMLHQRRSVYTYGQALGWAREIAQGLQYLHDANPKVIHRDMKLDNILLKKGPNGQLTACICDFGLHALLAHPTHHPVDGRPAAQDDSARHPERLWRTSSVELQGNLLSKVNCSEAVECGKVGPSIAKYKMTGRTGSMLYMAPEVLLQKTYNEKVDVFSFGVILYELFAKTILLTTVCQTGHPDAAECYAHQVAQGLRQEPLSSWPAPLTALIQQCQAGSPEQRPSMGDVVEQLDALAASGAIDTMDGSAPVKQGCGCTIM